MAKKEPKPKAPKKDLVTPKRVAPKGTSTADPGYPLPMKAPSYRDVPVQGRSAIDRAVSDAGMRVYNAPIKMADAQNTRINAVQAAIGRMPAGQYVPEGAVWYGQHQAGYKEVAQRTGTRVGSIIDAGAVLSARNTPAKERLAAESAGHIAADPNRMVKITPEMAPHMGNPKITAGEYRIGTGSDDGDFSNKDVAHIGYAETQALKELGHVNKQGNALSDKRFTPREVTGVTLDSSGRPPAERAVAITRGKTFDEVTTGSTPKTRNYARAAHLASEGEDKYNTEIFRRMAQTPSFVEGTGGGKSKTYRQGHLWTASEETGFDPKTAEGADETVEDYVMNAMTAEKAAKRGGTGKSHAAAQEDLIVSKGKKVFDASFDPGEIRHSFNEEATRRSAMAFGIQGETITPRAAQGIAWTEYRRHNLGEDPEYNAAQKALAKKSKAVKTTFTEKSDKPEENGQLTLF